MLSPQNQQKFDRYFALQRVKEELLDYKQVARTFKVSPSTAKYFIQLFLKRTEWIKELRRKCVLPQIEGFDSRESMMRVYYNSLNKPPIRQVRKSPCMDCAANGLYAGIAVGAYRHLSREERKVLAKSWGCHTHQGRCEGAAEILDVP